MVVGTLALLAILMGGAGANSWPALANKELQHVIENEARRESAEEILVQMQNTMSSHLDRVAAVRKELLVVEMRYESTAADFRVAFGKLDKIWLTAENKLIDLRFKLRDLLTRDEWNALCKRVDDERDS